MQKNWYIVYTKTKCEKKVSGLLTKKKIENFCPINYRQVVQFQRIKIIHEPLFPSFVFARIEQEKISSLIQLENILNIVYWKGKPAIVQNEEIKVIKEFVSEHQNVELEKSAINLMSAASVIDRPAYSIDGNVVTIKNKSIKVNLPSLGYTMIAQVEKETVLGREVLLGKQEFSLQ
jgi:transcription antitermination factor NusG